MPTKQSTSSMIREAQFDLGSHATNQQIKDYCNEKYGLTPISQTIYSAIGSEWSRRADNISVKELSDIKIFIRKKFNGDKDKAIIALNIIDKIK